MWKYQVALPQAKPGEKWDLDGEISSSKNRLESALYFRKADQAGTARK